MVEEIIPAVSHLIERFLRGDIEDPHDLRGWAARHRAMPVVFDMGGCWVLQVDGSVASFTWDEFDDVRVEADSRLRNAVLFQAAQRYPELAGLVPTRPPDGLTCPSCGGFGEIASFPAEIRRSCVCCCGGLGWLPASEVTAQQAAAPDGAPSLAALGRTPRG